MTEEWIPTGITPFEPRKGTIDWYCDLCGREGDLRYSIDIKNPQPPRRIYSGQQWARMYVCITCYERVMMEREL